MLLVILYLCVSWGDAPREFVKLQWWAYGISGVERASLIAVTIKVILPGVDLTGLEEYFELKYPIGC